MTPLPPRPGPSHTAVTWALFLSIVFGVVVVVLGAMTAGWELHDRLAPDVQISGDTCPVLDGNRLGTLDDPCEGPR